MTDSQPPLSNDELVSAYLDGELSGEDLARAERLLAEQPGSRQLLEELRALGKGLRELPQSRLGDSFPDRVLRKAERQLLSGSVAAAETSSVPLQRPARSQRRWIYAAAPLAAAVLLAVLLWPRQPAKVAMTDLDRPRTHDAKEPLDDFERNDRFFAKNAPAAAMNKSDAAAESSPKAKDDALTTLEVEKTQQVADAAAAKDDAALRAALSRLGMVDLSDEIVRQVDADKAVAPPTAYQPLSVWSCTVSADAIEHDALGKVLVGNQVQVLDEQTLASTSGQIRVTKQTVAGTDQLVDVVLVTATPGQLGATLAELRSQSNTFRDLTHFGYGSIPTLPLQDNVGSFAAGGSGPKAIPQRQSPAAKTAADATVGTRNQADLGRATQQAAVENSQSSRAIRLQLNQQNAYAAQPAPPMPAVNQSTASSLDSGKPAASGSLAPRAKAAGELAPAQQLGANSGNALSGEYQRALFILRCPELSLPAASPPAASASPAKAK